MQGRINICHRVETVQKQLEAKKCDPKAPKVQNSKQKAQIQSTSAPSSSIQRGPSQCPLPLALASPPPLQYWPVIRLRHRPESHFPQPSAVATTNAFTGKTGYFWLKFVGIGIEMSPFIQCELIFFHFMLAKDKKPRTEKMKGKKWFAKTGHQRDSTQTQPGTLFFFYEWVSGAPGANIFLTFWRVRNE